MAGARGGDLREVAMVTPLYLHFAHICSLPALLSIDTYTPFLIIAYRQVKLENQWEVRKKRKGNSKTQSAKDWEI